MKVVPSAGVNVYDVLKYKNIIMAEQAVSQLEGALAQ
jgi:ribosomal protein L4